MSSFSERTGIKPINTLILRDSINNEIRNGLWSAFKIFCWNICPSRYLFPDSNEFIINLWLYYFKNPIDTVPSEWDDAYKYIRNYFFKCGWNEVYDFVEFCAKNYPEKNSDANQGFMLFCNSFLERELSAYRFIDGMIVPLTSKEEIVEIDEALENCKSIGSVHDHLKRAIELLADKKTPDYRNSIKESISAVEAICKLIIGSDKSTLGEALKTIDNKITMHPAFKRALSNIYGYTCDAEGIRHSLLDEPTLDLDDAKFMLVSCSAFTNYLMAKSAKSGIELKKKK
jgi:hypothetical protein